MTTGWAELLRDAMIEVAIDVFRCMEHRLEGTVIASELRPPTLAAIDSVDQLAEAKRLCIASGQPARVFRDFQYRTIDSWSGTRRVVAKAEHTLEGANPRFVVTSLKRTRLAYDARALYEDLYCARGEAENRIGEQFERKRAINGT